MQGFGLPHAVFPHAFSIAEAGEGWGRGLSTSLWLMVTFHHKAAPNPTVARASCLGLLQWKEGAVTMHSASEPENSLVCVSINTGIATAAGSLA